MKNHIRYVISLLILIAILLSCGETKKEPVTTTEKPVMKTGQVGKYSFTYSEVKGQVVVMFDGKGVNIGNKNVLYEDLLIISTFAKTINTISGFEDIEITSLGKQVKNMDTSGGYIRLKGKNCLYQIKFVTGGGFITDFVYNKCN